ncbi:MAG: hypothetical protein NTV44_05995 [Firmicutes bacterium]|nr:hypothetical protein [Bacillota bacterium]
MSLLKSFAICLAIDLGLSFLLGLMGFQQYIIDVVICFILALTFSILDFRRLPGNFLKNPKFHAHFATLFLLLLVVTYVIGYVL